MVVEFIIIIIKIEIHGNNIKIFYINISYSFLIFDNNDGIEDGGFYADENPIKK